MIKNLLTSYLLRPNSSRGFTLIELVVAIGILGILAVFAITALNPLDQFRKARDSERKSDLTQMQRVLEQYYQDHGSYPANTNTYTIADFNGNSVAWGGSNGWSPYVNLVPGDPTNTIRKFVYYAVDTLGNSGPGTLPQKYYLFASLEKGPTDPITCKATVINCINNPDNAGYCNCGSVPVSVDCGAPGKHYPCNYGVSSPNTTPDSP